MARSTTVSLARDADDTGMFCHFNQRHWNLKFIPFLQEVKYQNKLNSFCRIPYFYFKTRIKTTLPTKFIYENGRLLASSLYNKASPFLLSLSTKFNEITGYDEILALKEKVLKADLDFSSSREAFKEAQLQYNKVIQERNTCQQDINSLLQRKQMWGEKEVKFFTELCQKEYHLQELKEKLDGQYKSSEALVEARLNELMSGLNAVQLNNFLKLLICFTWQTFHNNNNTKFRAH
ncbi:uncharacterized protein LOC135120656 [Zophobas morio]|uniref:uncharacterized protein LOC135120656 n=1 Tax=Zophobas morio TaxID=2755281 RepID=UPI0030835EDD